MKEYFFHNHERKLVKDKLTCYKTQMRLLEEGKATNNPLYQQLKGKAELCGELLG